MNDKLKQFVDEADIQKAIHCWCSAIDDRNWASMRELLTDPVYIDYSSNGSVKAEMPREAWITRLNVLHGFDATLHMVSNLVIDVEGERAVCRSYVNALHFLSDKERELGAYACGVYVHELVRADSRWKITSATFKLAGRYSGNAAFQKAFERARELAADRRGAE
jgi:hypothetical protein